MALAQLLHDLPAYHAASPNQTIFIGSSSRDVANKQAGRRD